MLLHLLHLLLDLSVELVLKAQTLHVVHVAVAVEQVPLQSGPGALYTQNGLFKQTKLDLYKPIKLQVFQKKMLFFSIQQSTLFVNYFQLTKCSCWINFLKCTAGLHVELSIFRSVRVDYILMKVFQQPLY